MNALQTHFWAVRDYLAPVLRESKFKEHGRITPDEFVAAGDFLVYKFPTWSWSVGDSSKIRDFLPNDKQFLISRGVPCLRRVSQIERQAVGSTSTSSKDDNDASEKMINFQDGNERKGKGDEEDWLATHVDEPSSSGAGGIIDIPDSEPPLGASTMTSEEEDDLANRVADAKIAATSIDPLNSSNQEDREEIGDIPDIQDIPDMDDEDELEGGGELIEEENDPANAAIKNNSTTNQEDAEEKSNSNLLSVRTYDCLITYDKYYQTPRMWLIGYNESGQTLKPKEIFQDISSDYAQKTVTIEPFPHTSGLNTASVHPCKHANVMKKVIERMDGTVRDEQRKAKLARGQNQTTTSKEKEKEEKKKKGWTGGLGGAMKKVAGKETSSTSNTATTNTSGSTSPNQGQEEEETEVEGLRVDQYMIIFLKFMASIVPAIEIDATQAV